MAILACESPLKDAKCEFPTIAGENFGFAKLIKRLRRGSVLLGQTEKHSADLPEALSMTATARAMTVFPAPIKGIMAVKMTTRSFRFAFAALLASGIAVPVAAQQYQQELRHSVTPCQGNGPAVWLNVTEVSASRGTLRVQLYRGTSQDWLEKGRWLNRIEVPARAGSMQICMPVPATGDYAIAIRHDLNGNGSTDLRTDGGGMSNNPSINIFNLGRPGIDRTRFSIGREVKTMSIRMRYM